MLTRLWQDTKSQRKTLFLASRGTSLAMRLLRTPPVRKWQHYLT